MTLVDPPYRHTLPWFRLQLAQTDVPLYEQRIYDACVPRRSLQVCQLPLLTYSGVLQQNSNTTKRGRLLYNPGVTHLLYITQEAPEPMADRLFEALSSKRELNYYICALPVECLGMQPAIYLQDKPCKPLLSIRPPQR